MFLTFLLFRFFKSYFYLVERDELDELPELLFDKLRSSRSMSLYEEEKKKSIDENQVKAKYSFQ